MPLKVDANSTLNAYDRLEKIFLKYSSYCWAPTFFPIGQDFKF